MRYHFSILILTLTFTAIACTDTAVDSGSTETGETEGIFPANFEWGTGTSAWQIEGGNTTSDWAQWESMCELETLDGQRTGTETIVDCAKNDDGPESWQRYDEDFALAQELGHTAIRMGIEWAKIEPEPNVYDQDAINHYHDVLDAARARGFSVLVTLQHFTLPIWAHNLLEPEAGMGGWPGHPETTVGESPIVAAFGEYAGDMAEEFGAKVDTWITINEPMSMLMGGYVAAFFPPGKSFQIESTMRGLFNIVYAHAAGYDAIHARDLVDADGDGNNALVSIAKNRPVMEAFDSTNEGDVESARRLEYIYNHLLLNGLAHGQVDLNADEDYDDAGEGTFESLANKLDWIGINYYGRFIVRDSLTTMCDEMPCAEGQGVVAPVAAEQNTDPARLYSDMAWELHPDGLAYVLEHAASFGVPLRITENGLADNDDELRARFIVSHLKVVQDAIEAGTDIRGYYHWSLVDNLEWADGFGPEFGLIAVDYESEEKTRTPRESASCYSEIIEAKEVTSSVQEKWGTLY
jgi:beta-glucosidase/6-phospho-beta-glucosidase/beta-galactosidase